MYIQISGATGLSHEVQLHYSPPCSLAVGDSEQSRFDTIRAIPVSMQTPAIGQQLLAAGSRRQAANMREHVKPPGRCLERLALVVRNLYSCV